jgi:alpha-2-macroglobulin
MFCIHVLVSMVSVLAVAIASSDVSDAHRLDGDPRSADQASTTSGALTIVSAGPRGEVSNLAEAREVRVVFSEPMVTLGRIPAVVQAPFFQISPAVTGTFRWSGTTILIFTPDPKQALPFGTRYDVTIDTSASAVSGRKLERPYSFTFTTPTVKLLQTNWYRRRGRSDAPMVILLRFNQPVRGPDIATHLSARLERHEFKTPSLSADQQARMKSIDPAAVEKFTAKVAAARGIASSMTPVTLRLTTEWDKKRFPPARDLVVLETTTPVAPESWVKLTLDQGVPTAAGAATPAAPQSYTIQAEPAFFVDAFWCWTSCNPDGRNPILMRNHVNVKTFGDAMRITELTGPAPREVSKPAQPKPRPSYALDEGARLTIEDGGYDAQPPASTYAVALNAALQSVDGQTLGYPWVGVVENWHRTAFTSFGDGHGVWETGGGPLLPFYARNLRDVKHWLAPVKPDDLMPTIRRLLPRFDLAPDVATVDRRLPVTPDRIQSHGIDASAVLSAQRTGLLWAAVENGTPIERADPTKQGRRASIIQVTNLGLSIKDSPQNTLIFVTRLDTGAPVPGAKVSVVMWDNTQLWTGTTGADGVATGPGIPRHARRYGGEEDEDNAWYRVDFLVTAEKDGDIAYAASNWNEGIDSWEFGIPYNREQSEPMLRGTVFSDRGVYRLGEEVHFKAILRENAASGIRLLKDGTPILISLRDSQNRLVDERTVTVNAWSSAEWTLTLPQDGSLGSYSVRAILESDRPKPKAPEQLQPGDEPGPRTDDEVSWLKSVYGSFLVAAYRRPDFRVDVTLTGDQRIAGQTLKGAITAKYLFGAAMGVRPVKWSFTRSPVGGPPSAIRELFSEDQWLFVGWSERRPEQSGELRKDEAELTKTGELLLQLKTPADAGVPYSFTLEGDVEDVSRQHIANRASLVVHPAPWYVGVKRLSYFIDQKTGAKTAIVTVAPDGKIVAGVPVEVKLTQVQWHSVRRAEGNGFYTWDTERKEVPAGSWTVTSAADPVPLDVKIPAGGYFILEATARGEGGRYAVTRTSFYAMGEGYTAWARYDHNRIDLVSDRTTYKPGDTARIMIQSPWEQATALVTTEREGIRTHRQFALTSTQQSITIPITEEHIPNVFVSVLLVKGRTAQAPTDPTAQPAGPSATDSSDSSDPGKPSFRLGYVELKVEDATKRLTMTVRADRDEYRPANAAKVSVEVKDHLGRGAPSEVTLWAVDYGVLSLTSYRTPDVLGSVWVPKALSVMNEDSRQRIISRRVLTPKGETEGGGGGADPGAGTLRKDFRVLAFWVGSVATDAYGRGTIEVKLPESLTTYRIMAVAADRSSRFGAADSEVRVNKPITLKPTFPRFLAVGDKALFGAVITNQLRTGGSAVVTIKSLDPDVLEFTGPAQQALPIGAGGSIEARFDAAGKKIGRARVQMTVKVGDESDAFEDAIPVEVLASPETVAAYGEVGEGGATATETLTVPPGVVPGLGGLHVEMASTAMVGLGEGARYLVEYPYGCAEQRGSRALAMLLAADLGDAFTLPGMNTAKMRPAVQQTLKELEKFQCPSGGFAYWPGACWSTSPYLTSYLLHVFKTAADLKYTVDAGMQSRAYAYLERELNTPRPENEGWWPAYTAWQAFAVKVLVEGGRNEDSHITRLYGYRERMPVFALAYLLDTLTAKGESSGARIDDLRRRLANAILPEGGSAHVEELSDPYLLWFWNSNVRSTAIVLNSLVRTSATATRTAASNTPADAQVRQMVRWMMAARKDGRWGNTQENAWAMEALVRYYRTHEAVVPDFRAVVKLGMEEIAAEQFKGRTTDSRSKSLPMTDVLAKAQPGETRALTFTRDGSGTLFYSTRLRYAADQLFQDGLDSGIAIERSYEPYVEKGIRPASLTYKAGELVRVTLKLHLTKERRYVAVTDPLPAGFEPVESWFATTAASLAASQDNQGDVDQDWFSWWQRGGFDHVERHDDRVQLFATRLSEGRHDFSYIVRATTAGTYRTAPARAEEMYEPEVFGRTATAVLEIRR